MKEDAMEQSPHKLELLRRIAELEEKIGLRHKVAVHIVDLIPQDLSDLRLIFAKEPTQISKEEMEQILEILNQYFPQE